MYIAAPPSTMGVLPQPTTDRDFRTPRETWMLVYSLRDALQPNSLFRSQATTV